MCCSGNHNHNRHKTSNTTPLVVERSKGKHHFPLMICCLIPIALLLFVNTSGIIRNLNGLFPILMIVVCVGSHLLMHGYSHHRDKNCCKSVEKSEDNN